MIGIMTPLTCVDIKTTKAVEREQSELVRVLFLTGKVGDKERAMVIG
jgi:hypothetical protein